MTVSHRIPFVATLLTLVLVVASFPAQGSAQHQLPTLVTANLTAPEGMVQVEGAGFTPGGAVRLVIQDLWNSGPTVEHWVVTPSGDLSESLAYLTASLHDQAGVGEAAATVLVPVTIHYMPPSDIDPAKGYASSNVVWVGGCPDLVVQAWNAETDTWSNQLGIGLAGC